MYQLRDYQNPEPVWEFYRQRKGDGQIHNALVVMPTGSGKSLVVSAIVNEAGGFGTQSLTVDWP